MIDDYTIVEEQTLTEMEAEVNKLVKDGYVPHGTLQFIQVPGIPYGMYCQAMVLLPKAA